MTFFQEARFTIDEIRFLKLLEGQDFFASYVAYTRKKCGIPIAGFPVGRLSEKNNLSPRKQRLLFENALLLVSVYDLNPEYWVATFVNIIAANVATPPLRAGLPSIEPVFNADSVSIVIREANSVQTIIDYLKHPENRKRVNKLLTRLKKPIKKKTRHIEIKLQLKALRDQGLSYSNISTQLEKLFSADPPIEITYDRLTWTKKRLQDQDLQNQRENPGLKEYLREKIKK